MSGFGNKRMKADDEALFAATTLDLMRRDEGRASGLDRLLLAIAMSEEIAESSRLERASSSGLERIPSVEKKRAPSTDLERVPSIPGAVSRSSSVTSFFSASLSRDPSFGSVGSPSPTFGKDIQEGLDALKDSGEYDILQKSIEDRYSGCESSAKAAMASDTMAVDSDIEAQRAAVLIDIDRLIDKLTGIRSDITDVCGFISDLFKRLFSILKCGAGVASAIFESKLYFRLFILISLIGYLSNNTCYAVINTAGAAIFKIMDFILQRFPENYAKLQAIFASINNVVEFIGAAFGLISDKGREMIECLKIMIELMEGATVDSIKLAIESFKAIVETLKIGAEDLKKILDAVKALGLSGEEMAQMLLSIAQILAEMQAGTQFTAPSFLERLGQGFVGALPETAVRLLPLLVNAAANRPAIGNGMGGKRKKTLKKKKTIAKRRKQQRKSKRR